MYLKTAIIVAWLGASYGLLVFGHFGWVTCLVLTISVGLAVAAVGFDIQHDANHGSYSRSPSINRALGFTLDLVGGSSYVWSFKHNVFHHTYTNIAGADADLAAGPMLRFSPAQSRWRVHRLQPIYVWALYAMLPVKWEFFDDFRDLVKGRIAGQPFPRPSALGLTSLIGGRLFFFGWALVLPMFFHPIGWVLLSFALASGMLGLTLAITFQLAHCMAEAEFPALPADGVMHGDWAEHQVRTTVNFARNNPLLTWYLGGLNFQIEHHLFPKICHVHYPALSKIVEKTCADFGLPYHAHPTMRAALASHLRLLGRLGKADPVV